MKSTSDALVDNTMSLLLMGPPGGGKTTFALQWPGLWVADCDQNLSGPLRYLKQKGQLPTFSYDRIAFDDNDAPLESFSKQWERLEAKTKEAQRTSSVRTIFIDSLTHVDRILYQHCCEKQGVKELEWQQWNMYKNALYKFIMSIRASGKTLLVACHEKIEYDKKGQVEKYTPVVSTNLKDYFSYMFTDVWRCTLIDAGGGRLRATVTTHPTQVSDLKNSLLLGKEIEATYSAVQLALDKLQNQNKQ